MTFGGAIAWRKYLRALDRIGRELVEEAPFERGVEFVLRNPAKLRGLRERIDALAHRCLIKPADHAFAVHEIRRMLGKAQAGMAAYATSVALVEASALSVSETFERHRAEAVGSLRVQLDLLAGELN
jgi:hypothetical protein